MCYIYFMRGLNTYIKNVSHFFDSTKNVYILVNELYSIWT